MYAYVPHDGTPGFSNKIHIGKCSYGWEFLFAKNIDEFCPLKRKAIEEWLAKGKIIDEFGNIVKPEDFWNKIDVAKEKASQTGWYDDYYYSDGLRFTNNYIDFC